MAKLRTSDGKHVGSEKGETTKCHDKNFKTMGPVGMQCFRVVQCLRTVGERIAAKKQCKHVKLNKNHSLPEDCARAALLCDNSHQQAMPRLSICRFLCISRFKLHWDTFLMLEDIQWQEWNRLNCGKPTRIPAQPCELARAQGRTRPRYKS